MNGTSRIGVWAIVMACVQMTAAGMAAGEEARWRVLPIRSEAEFRDGVIGGEAEQHPQGMVRSPSDPDIIYLSHDVGQAWRSDDNGRSWHHLPGVGLHVQAGQSIAVDPTDPDTVLFIVDNAWDYLSERFKGLYRSSDGGQSWEHVLPAASKHQRTHQESIAFDPSSIDERGAQRWYAGFPGHALYRSGDGGRNWQRLSDLGEHDPLYAVAVHPGGERVYLASSLGLHVSEDGGETFRRLGDLPQGHVPSVRINPQNPEEILVTVRGKGLYRSRDGGEHFEPVHEFDAFYVFVHPKDWDTIYLVGMQRSGSLVSHDGGNSWHSPVMRPAKGFGRDTGVWKNSFDGPFSAVLPDPRDTQSAVGYSRATVWRTEDGGRTFRDSSTLWTGYAWGWFTSAAWFDRFDANRFGFFLYDVGSIFTENGGDYFERRGYPWEWQRDGLIQHSGMYGGDVRPEPGSSVIVATGGMYWANKLIRSENMGRTWQIAHDDEGSHLYVAFHTEKPDIVYAHDKRSLDGGRTFAHIEGLRPHGGIIVGMAPSQPDTVYAVSSDRRTVLRSDDAGETWWVYVQADWTLNRMDSKPTFRVDPADADRIYTLDREGDVAVFDGQRWRSLGVLPLAGGREQQNFVRAVAVDPRHPEIIYAGTNAPGRPWLFRSTDGGESWRDITGNLARLGAGGLAVHPLTGDVFTGGIAGTRVLAPPYESEEAVYHRLPDDWMQWKAQQQER